MTVTDPAALRGHLKITAQSLTEVLDLLERVGRRSVTADREFEALVQAHYRVLKEARSVLAAGEWK